MKISPTCPNYQNHKNTVVHFFILMLLLPQTSTIIYLKLKKNKGPKTRHSLFHFHFFTFHFFHFTSQPAGRGSTAMVVTRLEPSGFPHTASLPEGGSRASRASLYPTGWPPASPIWARALFFYSKRAMSLTKNEVLHEKLKTALHLESLKKKTPDRHFTKFLNS